jgi:hypothetical protein
LTKYPEWASRLFHLTVNIIKKLKIDSQDVLCISVEADNLMNIINDNFQNKKNDYFQVDTEGF